MRMLLLFFASVTEVKLLVTCLQQTITQLTRTVLDTRRTLGVEVLEEEVVVAHLVDNSAPEGRECRPKSYETLN